MPKDNWVDDPSFLPTEEFEYIQHLSAIPWNSARRPFWLHWCLPQTRAFLTGHGFIYRCACGGIASTIEGPYSEKNTRV